jgi:membrane-associated phospholipid phosphatase
VGRLPSADNEYTLSQLELGGGSGLALPERMGLPAARTAAALLALVVSAAAVTWADGLDWTPDRMLLVFLAPALVLGRGRRYLLDFVPFAVLILAYAETRGLAHIVSPHPFYRPQLWLEQHIFGGVPASWLQAELWHGTHRWYDTAAAKLLNLHFVVPPCVAFALWMRNRRLFYRFSTSMIVLSFASAAVFFVYPSAPPWAAGDAGLLDVVKLPPVNDVSALTSAAHAPANPFAAIPSLHAGYAFLVALTLAGLTRRRWLAALWFLYPLAQSIAVIYTGNHYVVDIVIGFAFAMGAYVVTGRIFRKLRLL